MSNAAVDDAHGRANAGHGSGFGLALGALGIVYGDLGTSPLYSFRETFGHNDIEVTETTAYGAASIIFWALIIVVSIKYLVLVMRADNRGEGGILALTALVMPRRGPGESARRDLRPTGIAAAVITLGVFGTALLYGDGLITPAISVLSAVEGFEVATSAFEDWVIPVAVVILVGLFAVQRRGTAGIAKVFGPIMVVWFAVIGVLGLAQIVQEPGVVQAVWPGYAVGFFTNDPGKAFLALGSIFLVLTGGEALYADMGHFGLRPIRQSWYFWVLPALLLNYFGQAALLRDDPTVIENPFYHLAPDWAVTPLAILATMATVIASQALISGAFSLTAQAINLDYLPRLTVRHTSAAHIGQIYVPLVNWLLMIGCVGLVLAFQSSSALAAAFGIAVTGTMTITTLLFYRVVRDRFGWSQIKAVTILLPLLLIDVMFFAANVPKIPDGGWFPLVVAFVLVVQMTTWRRGRQLVAARLRRAEVPLDGFVRSVERGGVSRVPGTAVYLFKDAGAVPMAMLVNREHHKVLHARILVVVVQVSEYATVAPSDHVTDTMIGAGIHEVVICHGFMEEPGIVAALRELDLEDGPFDVAESTFFLGDETIIASELEGMHPWREQLFEVLDRGAESAARFFELPPDRVVTVGTHVEI